MTNTSSQNSVIYFKKIFQPLLSLILIIFAATYWSPLARKMGIDISPRGMQLSVYFFQSALWILSTWLLTGLIDVFLWGAIFRNRLKIVVPALIKDIVKVILYFSAILCITTNVFGASITGFLAASGIIGLIIGFAVRNLIADLFNGLALNFDRPFSRGELLALNVPGVTGVLKVLDTTWRTTRFETESNDLLVIPNSKLASMVIINLSKNPQGSYDINVNVEAAVPPLRVLIILESAIKSSQGVLETPEPKIRIRGLKTYAATYKITYWLEPKKNLPSQVKHVISANILHHFTMAGLVLRNEVFCYTALIEGNLGNPVPPQLFLPQLRLFPKLNPAEQIELANQVHTHHYAKGTIVVELGTEGDSLFIVAEGLLNVWAKPSEETGFINVGRIICGEYFGEMSLLTGAPRSARITAETDVVLYEITKAGLAPLLQMRPQLIEHFSDLIAVREAHNREKQLAALSLLERHAEQESFTQQITNKIKHFFGFK
jgi:small-conductance mechanosensitive channel/CRP-like cAMP-binding protein